MQLVYFGHSCFSLSVAGKQLLFDPFVSGNPLAGHIDIHTIAADYIFVSHGHSDHIADAVAIAQRTGALVVAAWEVVAWLQAQGLTHVHPVNTGGVFKGAGFEVKCTHAVHSSSMPDGSYGGNPMGFIVRSDEGSVYYSGDTALTTDMQLVSMWAPDLLAALLPVGDNFTMGIDDAVAAAQMVQVHKVVGLHYDTFGYIKIDHEQALNAFAMAEKELVLLPVGGKTTL
jgi:L-ascorbate metabolism protein UlaG (beta-lactamase superfamily)